MKTFPLPLGLLFTCTHLNAAVVNVAEFQTHYQDLVAPWQSSIDHSQSITIDLSNLTGLTPGADIRVRFETAKPIIWTGGWQAATGSLTLGYNATLTLTVGSQSVQVAPPWAPFGPIPYEEGWGMVGGYEIGPVPDAITLTVPWGTDLSNVTFTATDRFSMSGTNTRIEQSSLYLQNLTFSTASVPEPSAFFLTILSSAALLRRRRPKEGRNAFAECA